MKVRFHEIARMLHEARTGQGLTQGEVAQLLGYVSPQFVSNWERGLSAPPLAILRKVAKIYKIEAEEIFRLIIEDMEEQMRKEFMRGSGR